MITTVMFDMGGTLEDIYVDDRSKREAIEKLNEILKTNGLDTHMETDALLRSVEAGWQRYGAYRDPTNIELKPIQIWCDYALSDFNFPREKMAPICEEIAHMWEVTHYHRALRPRVREMLDGLRGLHLKLGVISNTASLFQVFDVLEEYGIRDCFEDVTLSSVTGLRKPAGDIFTVSLRQLCAKPEECIYVGDTVSRDVIGAKRAGYAAVIQIGSQLTKEKDVGVTHEYEPDYVISDIYDVYPLTKKMLAK